MHTSLISNNMIFQEPLNTSKTHFTVNNERHVTDLKYHDISEALIVSETSFAVNGQEKKVLFLPQESEEHGEK